MADRYLYRFPVMSTLRWNEVWAYSHASAAAVAARPSRDPWTGVEVRLPWEDEDECRLFWVGKDEVRETVIKR